MIYNTDNIRIGVQKEETLVSFNRDSMPNLFRLVQKLSRNLPNLSRNIPNLSVCLPKLFRNLPNLISNLPNLSRLVQKLSRLVPNLFPNYSFLHGFYHKNISNNGKLHSIFLKINNLNN